jgi:4-hydroxybenzoate polyprenyltransferase
MLQKPSQSPVAKMKRNLLWELIAVIILYSLGMIYFIATFRGRYWELAGLLFLIGLFFVFYYSRKNRLLREMQCVTCEVRSNLERQLTTLEKYVRFYFVSGTILTPFAYFASGFVVLFKSNVLTEGVTDIKNFYVIIVIGIVVTIGSYFLNRWYVRKLYGQHIKRLKELLLQMEESEPVI